MADPTADNLQFGRRQQDSGIIVKLELLHDDVSDMKAVLRELTTAINRLAIVEERQQVTAAALERAFGILEKVESRLATLELANVNTSRSASLVDKGIWLVLGGVIVAGLTAIGIHSK